MFMPPVGFEPTAPSLRDWCSTTELKRPFQSQGDFPIVHNHEAVWPSGLRRWF